MECVTLIISEITVIIFEGASKIFGEAKTPKPPPNCAYEVHHNY